MIDSSVEKTQEQNSVCTPPDQGIAKRLRPPQRAGAGAHFKPTDPTLDLTRVPVLGPLLTWTLKKRALQFSLILPNEIIFWIVILSGILGVAEPGRNFATAITWYLWFCVVFVLMVTVGRGWCAMCPFGGLGEWVQRKGLWPRQLRPLTLGLRLPESWAGNGLVISAGVFVFLTWLEEYFNIAGPGVPMFTSFMVMGIVGSSVIFFLVFERRTFCRYVCPLSAVIGTIGATGMVAGFRTRDRDKCLTCETKDCMRGGENGHGCPWYTWPGSADSNLMCGLCTECFKACPHDNIGLYVQAPLTSVIAPPRRRPDVAWAVAILLGLVLFQQVNSLSQYTTIDTWLATVTHFPGYPNPIDYLGIIALWVGVVVALAAGARLLLGRRSTSSPKSVALPVIGAGGARATRARPSTGGLLQWFAPMAYGLIPVMGADYLARQLPKFFNHVPRVLSAVTHPFGIHTGLYGVSLLPNSTLVDVQVGMVAFGALGAVYATWRIATRDLSPLTNHPRLTRVVMSLAPLAFGVLMAVLYISMQGAE